MKQKWKALLLVCTLICMAVFFAGCKSDAAGGSAGNTESTENAEQTDEYGSLTIEDLTVYINSNKIGTFAEITPTFSRPEKAEELTYTYDTEDLNIEGNVVTPLKRADKTVNVRAESEHFETVFRVNVVYIRFTGNEASTLYDIASYPVAERAQTCEGITADTTLFIGDSFMDDYFIGDYMDDYGKDKEVLHAGMSSTTSYHWEAAYSQIIGETAPKNIVLHIGTNNFYDIQDSVEETEQSLIRLFTFIHNSYPESNIYWFNITQRQDTKYSQQVSQTNSDIAAWCEKYDWITCVDTCSKVTTSMLRDGVHPTTESYQVFTDALAAAGCEIVNK